MASGFEIPGGRHNTLITTEQLNSIKTASDRDSIGSYIDRIYDKVKDWFCGTQHAEVKKHIFDLYSPNTTHAQKTEAFQNLKNMTGHGYKDRFTESPTEAVIKYGIIFGDIKHENYELEINVCNLNYVKHEVEAEIKREESATNSDLARDLARAKYSIAGEVMQNLSPKKQGNPGNLEQFEQNLRTQLECTSEQLKAIKAVSYQNLFGIITQSASLEKGGLLDYDQMAHLIGTGNVSYDFVKVGEKIQLSAHFKSKWAPENSLGERAAFLQEPIISARLTIAQTGEITVNRVSYGVT